MKSVAKHKKRKQINSHDLWKDRLKTIVLIGFRQLNEK